MKIFWSWQSDTQGKTGRHFVKKAIETAIEELREEVEVDESTRDLLHIDHDRKGVPGSPDLARTILDKINNSSVFIADVTPVGKTPEGKKILNPNVGIELGYALAKISDAGILMILNTFYGDRESLPFDLRHKAGPITYELTDDSSKEEILKQSKVLVGTFKVAIRDCIKNQNVSVGDKLPTHTEIESKFNNAVYFNPGDVIGERVRNGATFSVKYQLPLPVLYLRLIPQGSYLPLKRHEVREIVYGIKIPPLRKNVGGGASWELNEYGGITYSEEKEEEDENTLFENIFHFTTSQVFLNREIWGIDATMLSGQKTIPSFAYEEMFEAALGNYLEVAISHLQMTPPFIIEAGAADIKGFTMAMGSDYIDRYWGPIQQNEIRSRHILQSMSKEDMDIVLLSIFEDFFDAVGMKRPQRFRDFPK